MSALADEYVRIRADTSYLSKDLKKQGRTSGNNLGQGILGGLKSIAGPVAGILAGLGVLKYLADATEAARESQKIGRQTAAVLKSTGGAAKITQRDIENLSGSIAKKTGIDDEAIQSSANLLLTFTGVRNEVGKGNDIFNQATKTVQDMSVALGQDGKTSAIQLGKALNDPIAGVGALRRVGVSLTSQQKEQIKTLVEHGDKLGAQKIILAELSKEFGGSAEAQATWADKVQVAFGDVQETVGGFLNDTLEPIAKWFAEEGLPAVQDFFKKISTDKNLKTAITNLKNALTTLTGDVDFRESLNNIANSLPPIVQGLADIVTKYGEIAAAVDKFENMSFGEGDKRGGPVGQIVKDFKAGGTIETALIYFRTAAPKWVERAWDDMTASFRQRASEAVAGVARFVGDIVAWFINMKNRVVEWVKRMWNEARSTFTQRAREVVGGVTRFKDQVIGVFTTLKTRVVSTATSMMTTIRTGINTGLNAVRSAFSSAVAAIGRVWDGIKEKARVPVAFVVNTVINDGLLAAVRTISKFVGYTPGENLKVSMARGGILPGYTPGKDVHRFFSATGGILDLSGGEGIARPELARAVGKDRWTRANRAAAHGRLREAQGYLGGFALGGFLGGTRPVPPGSTTQHSGYPWATWAGDLGAGMNTPVRAWKAGIIAAVRSLSGSYGKHIIENVGGSSVYYAHLARAIVNGGQSVSQGQLIGYSDSTGNSTGPHLHFEIRGGGTSISGGGAGGSVGLDPGKYLDMVTGALDKLKSIRISPFGEMVAGVATKLAGSIKDKIISLAGSFLGPGPGGSGTALGNSANKAIVQRAAAAYGWNTGSQWNALVALINGESGFRNTAQNPSSSAYGLFQFLDSTWASVGARKTSDPWAQSVAGLRYIDRSYGSPINAYSKWASRNPHWYGNGGVINEPIAGVGLRTGQRYGFGERGPETITPGRGGRPINIMIDLGNGLVESVQGMLDEHDEFHASVARMHR